jgi:hypothetical protein
MTETVEPGKWYLLVNCRNCSRSLAFREAPLDPAEPVPLPTKLQLACHACGHSAEYDPSEVRRARGRYKH